jgi:hypothetical protein
LSTRKAQQCRAPTKKNGAVFRLIFFALLFLVWLLLIQLERERIDAKALAGRFGAVVKNVSQVGAAFAAHDFVALHAMAGIGCGFDRV